MARGSWGLAAALAVVALAVPAEAGLHVSSCPAAGTCVLVQTDGSSYLLACAPGGACQNETLSDPGPPTVPVVPPVPGVPPAPPVQDLVGEVWDRCLPSSPVDTCLVEPDPGDPVSLTLPPAKTCTRIVAASACTYLVSEVANLVLGFVPPWDPSDPCGSMGLCVRDGNGDGRPDSGSANVTVVRVQARDGNGDGAPEADKAVVDIGVYVPIPSPNPGCGPDPSCFIDSLCVVCVRASVATVDENGDGVPDHVEASPGGTVP